MIKQTKKKKEKIPLDELSAIDIIKWNTSKENKKKYKKSLYYMVKKSILHCIYY